MFDARTISKIEVRDYIEIQCNLIYIEFNRNSIVFYTNCIDCIENAWKAFSHTFTTNFLLKMPTG